MRRSVWILAVVATGCLPKQPTARFVTNAHVVGYDLVVTHCDVTAHDDSLAVDGCTTEHQPLPVMVVHDAQQPAPVPVPVRAPAPASEDRTAKLDRDQVAKGIAAVKPALATCAARRRSTGRVQLRVEVGPDGATTSVSGDDTAFAACAQTAFGAIAFPATRERTRFAFTYDPEAP